MRIEDLDSPRVVPGSADRILRTLEAFELHWDGPVEYQSRRLPLYREALERLGAAGWTYECSCSRKELAGSDTSYPGTCRAGPTRRGPTATRFRVPDRTVVLFDDRVQGPQRFAGGELADFVLRRKDGIIAYQLAVVVDDEAQQVSDVVRGADLLQSTGWQVALQGALGSATPRYAHLPLVMERTRGKLGKSRRSLPVKPTGAAAVLTAVLRLLNQGPPPDLQHDAPGRVLQWGWRNWRLDTFQGVRAVTTCDSAHAK